MPSRPPSWASDVSGIVICGAAGVGKSRIARDALSAAVSRGCEGRWAVGTSVAKTMPLGAPTAWAHSGVTDTAQLVRGVIESLTAAPAGTAVVFGVDDVHLLDDLSIFVVQQIVQRGGGESDPHRARWRSDSRCGTGDLAGWPVRPARSAASIDRRIQHPVVGHLGRIGGSGCRPAAVDADSPSGTIRRC